MVTNKNLVGNLAIVEVDSKGRILIPREIRKRFEIKKGMKAYLLPTYADKKIELTFGEIEPLEETTRILKNIKWKEEEHRASKLALKLIKKR